MKLEIIVQWIQSQPTKSITTDDVWYVPKDTQQRKLASRRDILQKPTSNINIQQVYIFINDTDDSILVLYL